MVEKHTFDVICPFCGNKRQGVTETDDGCDWEGHHRGRASSETYIEKCNCKFGQLVKTMPRIKRMCRNCFHYINGCCTNQEEIEQVKKLAGNFDITVNKFSVKDPNIACMKHELDYGIFDELFEEKSGRKK